MQDTKENRDAIELVQKEARKLTKAGYGYVRFVREKRTYGEENTNPKTNRRAC